MADYIDDNEIPVFLINGFLESGKTAFIEYTMGEDYFTIDGNTLLIVCEEGEVEYDKEELKESNTYMEIVDDQKELTKEYLEELGNKYNAERVIIEFNGMWNPDMLVFPKDWVLFQQVSIMNGETLDSYLANMKALMGPMLRYSELCIVNRCDDIDEAKLLDWKKKLRPMMPSESIIVMENRYGEIPLENLPEELPYDINADIIDIEPEDFGIWFFDAKDMPERYLGKTVRFTAQVMKSKRFGEYDFVPGRMAMTCCEADMTFIGFLAHFKDLPAFENRSWVKLTAKFEIKNVEDYHGEGPYLEVIEMIHTGKALGPVGF